jgi:glutamate carboxypeptidase
MQFLNRLFDNCSEYSLVQTEKHQVKIRKIINRILFVIAIVALSSIFNYAQKISADEQKIVNYIDAHTEDAIALLEKTVNIESPTENLSGVRQVGMIFKEEFQTLGFTGKWLVMPADMKRAGHLIAEKTGTRANEFC